MTFSRVIATGSYLPSRCLENRDLERSLDTTDAWIRSRTGIHRRHLAADGESNCDMAEQAAQQALAAAGLAPAAVELIVVATSTSEQSFPSTACLLQERLGAPGGPAFDVQAACAGFLYALDLADKFIRTGTVRNALVVGSDIMSRLLDWQDRSTCILFGDGAGAMLLQSAPRPGLLASRLRADGRHHRLLYAPRVGASEATSGEGEGAFLRMQGREVFRLSVTLMQQAAGELLRETGITVEEIDWLVPHQANRRILLALAQRLGLPMEKVIVTLNEHGNTSAASIPLAMDHALREGRIRQDQTLLLQAFGGGFAWGTGLMRF